MCSGGQQQRTTHQNSLSCIIFVFNVKILLSISPSPPVTSCYLLLPHPYILFAVLWWCYLTALTTSAHHHDSSLEQPQEEKKNNKLASASSILKKNFTPAFTLSQDTYMVSAKYLAKDKQCTKKKVVQYRKHPKPSTHGLPNWRESNNEAKTRLFRAARTDFTCPDGRQQTAP